MLKRCFIENCYAGKDKENGPAIFFRIPKHRLEEWRGILPKMGLLDSSRLCRRHFDEEDIIKGLKRQQNNSRPALEDLTQNGPEGKKKKQQSRCKKITSLLGTPISSLVQNQFTTLPHTDCTKSSQPITESLCTNALSDSGFSQVKTFDVLLMDSAPVPITTTLPDPGSSQVTTFDDSLLDSALVPITTALPDPGSSQVMFEDDFPIDTSLGPDDLIGIITYLSFTQQLYYLIIFVFRYLIWPRAARY
ncbi:uncharacterized protein LOC116930550 [Daphnia magna]|uniref:uncharacterized protein LOC116930550 n=1 Tax=Daphnia magna TaxID=35525 RepID=UPI001E1BD67B|nr:uncharacterized protein LOC116930550 [Daphnia magna]